MVRDFGFQLYEGSATLEVVGESHYQQALWQIVGGLRKEHVRHDVVAVLVPEPENPYDENAVSAWVDGLHVGYLSREDAAAYQPGLVALQSAHRRPIALRGVVVGGGPRHDGLGRLGVFLSHDPRDFGVRGGSGQPATTKRLRTGFLDAKTTDENDSSYDLSWHTQLPEDAIAAIKMLRRLLRTSRIRSIVISCSSISSE